MSTRFALFRSHGYGLVRSLLWAADLGHGAVLNEITCFSKRERPLSGTQSSQAGPERSTPVGAGRARVWPPACAFLHSTGL